MKIALSSTKIQILDLNIKRIESWLKGLTGASDTQTKSFRVLAVHGFEGTDETKIIAGGQYFKGISQSAAAEVTNLNNGILSPGWYSKEPLRACDFINGKASGVRINDTGILAVAACSVFGIHNDKYGKTANSMKQFPGDRLCVTPKFIAAALIQITGV